ncbi:MAG: hypothetical protein ABGY71_11195 [bacterium]|jgi:hypothetical protein|nr:hypothetical protein [Planctomycetota bacterium]HIL51021.1 hypothetical protein [Planctomycetota bacterium]
MHKPKTLVALLCVLSLAGFAAEEELRFDPAENATLTVSFEQSSVSELVEHELVFLIDGEEDESMQAADIEVERRFSERIIFSDEFQAVEDGQATRVRRSFDEISQDSLEAVTNEDGDEYENEEAKVSPLEGLAVDFRWDDDDEEYSLSFGDSESEDEEPDEEVLETLDLTGYLVELLPDEEVSEGDTWQVDPTVYRTLIYPGGDLSYSDAGDEDQQAESEEALDEKASWQAQYNENFSGEINLEHLGFRKEEGTNLMVIGIEIEVETAVETEESVSVEINDEEGQGTVSRSWVFTFSLAGKLLWNAELGLPVSLEIAGERTHAWEDVQDMVGSGLQIEIITTRVFEGEMQISYTIE